MQDVDIAQLREFIKARDASIEEFKQTTSWKLMAPLRLTMHLFRFGITAAEKVSSELSVLRKWSNGLARQPPATIRFHHSRIRAGNRQALRVGLA
jgi:hypothetical protein